jgi:hypothetical protein
VINVKKMADDEVFVFGSNEAGRHGAGAAKTAMDAGAVYGVGFGHQGSTFAIPTKDWHIYTLSLDSIKFYVNRFLAYADTQPDLKFLVTRIGCGLAGYKDEDIAPLFSDAPSNVILPDEWKNLV